LAIAGQDKQHCPLAEPNTRQNVSSSVPLGWAEVPGCVCNQIERIALASGLDPPGLEEIGHGQIVKEMLATVASC
jgi:hypothetical protein